MPATKSRQYALSRHTHDLGDLSGTVDWNTQLANIPAYVASLAAFNEAVDDRVGALFIDSAEVDFTYNDGANTMTAALITGSVALSKLANLATARFMGRVTAGTGVPEALTGTQATTLLDLFSSTLKGLVPLSGGGSTNYLRADGTWAAPPGTAGATGANPSASIGLAAVNGVAATFLRSDGAPALDQGIAPTWTAAHVFSLAGTGTAPTIDLASARPVLRFSETDQVADGKSWYQQVSGGTFSINSVDDTVGTAKGLLTATRTANVITAVDLGNATDLPPIRLNGNVGVRTAPISGSPLSVDRSGVAAAVSGLRVQDTTSGSGSRLYLNLTNNTDADLLTRVSEVGAGTVFSSMGPSTATDFQLRTADTARVVITSDGRLYGSALHNVGTVTGTANQYIASGTYTPTLTAVTNVAASTSAACQWMRVGNVVTVSGSVSVTATAAGVANLAISLPIASALTLATQLGGTAAQVNGTAPAEIFADATNDRADARWTAVTAAAQRFSFSFTYVVL